VTSAGVVFLRTQFATSSLPANWSQNATTCGMPKKNKAVAALEPVGPLIREVRGVIVMLDSDLA
jgi:hypothetical protein